MSLLVFQHHVDEDTALLGSVLAAYGHQLRTVALYDGEAVPADLDDIDGVISMGGPMNVEDAADHAWIEPEIQLLRQAHEAQLPMVGICLGCQLIATALGGQVEAMEAPEAGFADVTLSYPGTIEHLFGGVRWNTTQFHLHGQHVTKLPPEATPLAGSSACRTQAFAVGLRTFGFQYHFEWGRADIEKFVGDELVAKAGLSSQQITQQCDVHFDDYRHMGDRLCDNLAMLLFPVDKR